MFHQAVIDDLLFCHVGIGGQLVDLTIEVLAATQTTRDASCIVPCAIILDFCLAKRG